MLIVQNVALQLFVPHAQEIRHLQALLVHVRLLNILVLELVLTAQRLMLLVLPALIQTLVLPVHKAKLPAGGLARAQLLNTLILPPLLVKTVQPLMLLALHVVRPHAPPALAASLFMEKVVAVLISIILQQVQAVLPAQLWIPHVLLVVTLTHALPAQAVRLLTEKVAVVVVNIIMLAFQLVLLVQL